MTLTSQHANNMITATSSSDDGHVAANTLLLNKKGIYDVESRWSAQGDGEWIQYELGDDQALVKSMDIAFYQGDKRKAYFELQISSSSSSEAEASLSWTTVTPLQGNASSGTTSNFERFDFPNITPRGRFVRFLGHGNSVNMWNSVLKVKIDFTTTRTTTPAPVPVLSNQTAPSVAPPAAAAADVCPNVKPVWLEDFESLRTGSYWKNNKRLEVVACCGGVISKTNNSSAKMMKKCLRVSYVPTPQGSERLTVKQSLKPAALEYTLNYDVLFEKGFEFVRGGKLPGLFPTHYTVGCKEQRPDGWSVRAMWIKDGEAILYVYDQNRERHCGNVTNSGVKFGIDTRQAVSLYVKVNQPASASNGAVSLYMDGTRIAHVDNVQLRGVDNKDDTLITQFIFNTFFGGHDPTWSPSKTVYARFGNFAVYPGLRVRWAPGQ